MWYEVWVIVRLLLITFVIRHWLFLELFKCHCWNQRGERNLIFLPNPQPLYHGNFEECVFSYYSSVYCRSAAVTNSCINHCHDNSCNKFCQIVLKRWDSVSSAHEMHRCGWSKCANLFLAVKEAASSGTGVLGKSPSLPAFFSLSLGADQTSSPGSTCEAVRWDPQRSASATAAFNSPWCSPPPPVAYWLLGGASAALWEWVQHKGSGSHMGLVDSLWCRSQGDSPVGSVYGNGEPGSCPFAGLH